MQTAFLEEEVKQHVNQAIESILSVRFIANPLLLLHILNVHAVPHSAV
jgi:hypothetical protein